MSLGDVAAKLPWPVFACDAEKRPVVRTGFKAATRDVAAIAEQFAAPAAQMIGVPTGSPSGIVAIDIDIKNGARGQDWLTENADALPETRTHKTRSGGLHLIFIQPDGVEIRNSAGRVAQGVDVRGAGGYIIVPPSPGYSIADPTEPAEMPRWLIRACMRQEPEPQTYTPSDREISDRYVSAAIAAECQAVASAGEGTRNDRLNQAAFALGQFVAAGALPRSAAEGELTNAGRGAGLAGREIAATIKSGLDAGMQHPRSMPEPKFKARTNGAHAARAAFDETPEPDAAPTPQTPLPLEWFDAIKPSVDVRDFVQGTLIEQGAAVVYGESNSGKTFLVTDLALHVAAGIPWNGKRVEQGGVIYCVLEGGQGFRNRVAAWKTAHDALDDPVHFAAIPSAINLLNPEAHTEALIATILAAAAIMGCAVKLVVVDTLARALAGGNENSPEDMGALVMNMDRIRVATGALVLFVHHSGKDQAKGARGHSSLRAAIDTEIEVVDEEGAPCRVATVVKQRDLKKGDKHTFTLEVVEIGTNRHGETVTTCLVKYSGGEAYAGASLHRRRLKGHNKRALEVLADLVATSGKPGMGGAPAHIPTVPDKWWRERFYEAAMPGAEPSARKMAFQRASTFLLNENLVDMAAGRVWIQLRTVQEETQTRSHFRTHNG